MSHKLRDIAKSGSQELTYDIGDDNREAGTVEALKRLLKQGVNVVLYAGDAVRLG
jgi:hypothetical protein